MEHVIFENFSLFLMMHPFSFIASFIALLVGPVFLAVAIEHKGNKKCPDCAETVKKEAKKCRYCSYRFCIPNENEQS
ncbi:MAG: hypothetical protein K2Z81_00040 [Cyanobacteria bacterium]|nr:hypothetical protein [Cyanobacteriota bacterium]